MSRRVDPNTIPENMRFKSTDFVASDAVKCAPLGGVNEFSVDSSVVMNLPVGPDGEYMVAIWGNPKRIPYYEQQGIRVVTPDTFRRYDLYVTSPTVDTKADLVYKDGRHVCLMWTTRTNYDRLQRNSDEAARKSRGGKSVHYQTFLDQSNAFGERIGISHHTVDSFVDGGFVPSVTPPGGSSNGRVSVSMAGPRKSADASTQGG